MEAVHDRVVKLRSNPQRRRDTVYVGCGAGFGGDRPMAALRLLERVKELNYLVLECLAEQTLADRYQIMIDEEPSIPRFCSPGVVVRIPSAQEVVLKALNMNDDSNPERDSSGEEGEQERWRRDPEERMLLRRGRSPPVMTTMLWMDDGCQFTIRSMEEGQEIYQYQHNLGLVLLERKELTSKFEQLRAASESAEIMHKRECATQQSALAERTTQQFRRSELLM
ncbi:hypothetical protein E2562_013590 [Oryza meyeriana var. granulata]|uniref:Acyclic terpene utilisation N-terminal domain-containing protein n=1 Tax=Oryza meyeriana var. granulata TaxID=110450 RepID=A0A6G1C6R5_9ORYZ|nr:hypothetical protein E2562_013590 [Oryza meyeriana var. granulata]